MGGSRSIAARSVITLDNGDGETSKDFLYTEEFNDSFNGHQTPSRRKQDQSEDSGSEDNNNME